MELTCKTMKRHLIRDGTVKLPAVMVEECGLQRRADLDIHYGKNYNCVVIIPTGTYLGAIVKERINKLVSEPLNTER